MSDTPTIAEVAAEHAADETERAVEAATAGMEMAIEDANARADASAETAERIAEAAMESERGREIIELRQRVETWRDEDRADRERMQSEMMELRASFSTLTETLSLQAQPPSIPTASPEPVEIPITEEAAEVLAETTDPLAVEAPAEAPVAVVVDVAAPAKKRRWLR